VIHLVWAFLFAPLLPAPTLPALPAAPYAESGAVLLNLSERSLNRIVVDSFRANGGPRVAGERARVSSRVGDLRYRVNLSEPVFQLGGDGTARLSLDILEASLRIGRLERRTDGSGARCEGAGLDVDPAHPLRVELAMDFAIEEGALRILPRNVEITDLADRLLLVGPTRCTNSLLPTWFLWWIGKPFIRRSVDNLDQVLLERARKSAARLESKQGAMKGGLGAELHLTPAILDTRGGSLLVGLTASSMRTPSRAVPALEVHRRSALPSESFLGISEAVVNEVARRAVSRRAHFTTKSSLDARRILSSDAVYALVPGLRSVGSKEQLDFEVVFHEAPRVEFRTLADGRAAVRVLVTGVDIDIRRNEPEKTTRLGTLHIASGQMAAVPFANLLGGISFQIVENRWRTSSSGLAFDDELVAATLQEITFGKIFQTSYQPLWARDLRIGDTAFRPRSFAAVDGYLVIGLEERPPAPSEPPAAVATGTETPLGSR